MFSRRGYTALAVFLAVAAACPARAAPDFAMHKALYELNMVAVKSGAGVVGIHGTMYYEQADTCDAWTTDQRFTMEYQYPERVPVNNTNHYVAWEAKDGSRLEFNSQRQENGSMTEMLRGSAMKAEGGTGEAQYTRPGGLSFTLPEGFLLPVAHTDDVLRRARAGERFFNSVMFDGTDAEGPVTVSTFIGEKVTPEEIRNFAAAGGKDIDMSLLPAEAWHVRMAVFPLEDAETVTPSYEMDIVLHANGVVSHALVDYNAFKVEQTLKNLSTLPKPDCS